MHARLQMPREVVANLHGESLCFSCVRFIDEDSDCCGCEISISCSSVCRKLWDTLRNVIFLLLLHVTLKYTTVSLYTALVSSPDLCSHCNPPQGYSLLLYFVTFILGSAYLLSAIVFSVYKRMSFSTIGSFHGSWFHFLRARVWVYVWGSCVQNTGKEVVKVHCTAASLLHVCPPEAGHLIDIWIS